MKQLETQHLLVVDDDPVVGELLKQGLHLFGHSVQVAHCGKEALKLIERTQFDLVFTDYRMPDIWGDELAQAIKARYPDTPVVMITGAPPDTLPPCVDLLVLKPCRVHEIGKIVFQWAKRRRENCDGVTAKEEVSEKR